MKILQYLLSVIVFPTLVSGQQSPYTGGVGSGYNANFSAATACQLFYGGSADGAATNYSPTTLCTQFYGGNADGAAANLSALTLCQQFFGGSGDGYAMDSSGCITILAIRNLDFWGQNNSKVNTLHWRTDEGYKVKTFEVERSADGVIFSKIGSVEGNVNSNFNYLYVDNHPFPDINFYRLRIIEKNSEISYSKIIVLKNSNKSFTTLYPNPFKGATTLYYYSEKNQSARLMIYQSDGKIVLLKSLSIIKGENKINLDMQGLASGIYFLLVREGNNSFKLLLEKN